MKCAQVQEFLPDYAVELLDARKHREVELHLAECDGCRAELKAQDAVMALVEQYGAMEPPVGLFNGVRNRIESGAVVRERPAWWAWFNTVPARAAGMGLAVAALAIGVFFPVSDGTNIPLVPMHVANGPAVTSTALASSIRQHAMSSADSPLADRVAWEAMAQLVAPDGEAGTGEAENAPVDE